MTPLRAIMSGVHIPKELQVNYVRPRKLGDHVRTPRACACRVVGLGDVPSHSARAQEALESLRRGCGTDQAIAGQNSDGKRPSKGGNAR